MDGLEGKKRIKKNTRHGISRNQISRSKGWKASERSERALFPEGRGLGVGRKKKKVEESKSKTELHLMQGVGLACMNEHKTPL